MYYTPSPDTFINSITMADNMRFDVTSEGRHHFDMVMEIAFFKAPGGKVASYRLFPDKGLVLYWFHSKESKSELLPYDMNIRATIEFVWNWLDTVDYGEEPDHDGDNGKGWRIYNEVWSHINNDPYAFVAIQPVWMMYGK